MKRPPELGDEVKRPECTECQHPLTSSLDIEVVSITLHGDPRLKGLIECLFCGHQNGIIIQFHTIEVVEP